MGDLGTQGSGGLGNAGLTVQLNYFKGIFQPLGIVFRNTILKLPHRRQGKSLKILIPEQT